MLRFKLQDWTPTFKMVPLLTTQASHTLKKVQEKLWLSSLAVVVAQPDERHVNRSKQKLFYISYKKVTSKSTNLS